MELQPAIERVDDGWVCHAFGTSSVFGETPEAAYINWLTNFEYYKENGDAENF